jgi:pantothenate kinase
MVIPPDARAIAKLIAKGKSYVASIMAPYKNIPNSDMEVLQGVLDLDTGKSYDLVLRNMTEDYWRKVIEQCKAFRICAVGTPGIGKTTTTCILIRLLLKQNDTVVYQYKQLIRMVGFTNFHQYIRMVHLV